MARKPGPIQTRAVQAEEPSAPPRKNRVLRFLVLFPIFLAVGFCGWPIPFLHPVVLQNPPKAFAMEVLDGCNGDDVAVLLWAAILAYPASWLQKGKGLLAGTAAIYVINFLRIIGLFYLGQYNSQWFEFAHL